MTPIYTGVRHWTQEAALVREFQRTWNRKEREKHERLLKRAQEAKK